MGKQVPERRTITYVEFGSTGHRAIWMRGVVDAFKQLGSGWQLNIWVPEDFVHDHKEWCSEYLEPRTAFANNIFFKTHEQINADRKSLDRLNIIRRCVLVDHADLCFIALELDACLREIAFSRPGACRARLVGIRRGPFLHYLKFPKASRRGGPNLRAFFREYLLSFLVSHRRMVREILVLDPLAPAFYNRILGTSKFRYLPSDATQIEPIPNTHKYFGLPKDRDLLLFTGTIDKRKGIFEFFKALEIAFTRNPDLRTRVAVVFAGLVESGVKDAFYEAAFHLRVAYSGSSLFIFDRFLTDREYVSLISASSVVCIPYVKFVGMSGVLIHAVTYGRLVLASKFGLIGELVQRYDLGVVCDESNPAELADALCRCLDQSRRVDEGRRHKIRAFAARYSVPLERFGEEICASLVRAV